MPINQREIQQIGGLELIARQVVEGFITGLHKSPFHGFSVEFAEHRLYNTGESTKHIDWKLYARSEKLFVKRFEEETNLRCQLVIDNSSSMYYPDVDMDEAGVYNKIKFSVYTAAAMMLLLKKQRDAVGLSIFSDELELHTPSKSNVVHNKRLMSELDRLLQHPEDRKQTGTTAALHQIADSVHKRSLVIIFSDMMDNSEQRDGMFSALQHLRHNKHEIILFHVVDKDKELDFKFENRPYRFVDSETGEEIKAHPNDIKKSYIEAIQAHKKELKLRCGQFNIDYVEADINAGFTQVLLPYLLKREKLL
ncbi:MAG: DUF58 domain-containing protein [Flavobacteriales bacterium]|nr:DUF58 domain-containing protein [Flavobacteriales bacterium]